MIKKMSVAILAMLILSGICCFHQTAFAATITNLDGCPVDNPNCEGTTSDGTVRLPPPPPLPPPPSKPVKSAARFSGMTGEVRVSTDGGKSWKIAHLDMILNVEDLIKTTEDATAILSFADMTTFKMEPETTVVVVTPPEKTSKLKLVAGNIWVNVKKMIKDGSMEIDLNQAAASIKGTTFRLWETGTRNSSIVQVEEGVVAFRNKTTGQTVDVKAGQTVSATPAGLVNGWALGNTIRTNETILFDNVNAYQVFNGGKSQWFYLRTPAIISYIMTYHWNDGRGTPAGTIMLRNENGFYFGPWQATGRAGQGGAPSVNWEVAPGVVVPAGKYAIIDSDPSTWSQNTGAGITIIKGFKQ